MHRYRCLIVLATLALFLAQAGGAAAMKGENFEALIREAARRDVELRTLREAGYLKLEPEGFFLLCAKGSAAEVRAAIKRGADPKQPDEERGGTTALQDAARSNPDPEVIRILLQAGADPDIQGRVYKRTALHLAVLNNPNPVPVIRALLKGGADPDLYDLNPWTPLQSAINGRINEEYRHYMGPENDIILALVEGGASMNKGSGRNYTPLAHYLSEFGRRGGIASNNAELDLRVVKAMIKAGADVNALEIASIGNTDSPLLHLAIRLDSNRDVPEATLTALFLKAGANPLAKAWRGKTAMHQAAFYGNPKVAALLLKNTPKGLLAGTADQSGATALHTLARFALPELPEMGALLLKNGANINAADERGQTALHYLADTAGQAERRQLETPDQEQRFAAGQEACLQAAAFLMVNGADHLTDKQGTQPVHELCDGPALPRGVLMVLLKTGADLNAADEQGRTPLMLYTAAASKALLERMEINRPEEIAKYRKRMVEDILFLIECGADASRRNAEGLTAYELLPRPLREGGAPSTLAFAVKIKELLAKPGGE